MAFWKLKSCPKCNGNLFIQRETDDWYEACPSCGYQRDISNLVTENTVGQVKIKRSVEAEPDWSTDVNVTDENVKLEQT